MWNDSTTHWQTVHTDIISPDEECLMVNVLSEALRSGQNYRDALNRLDRVNNHFSGTWKDHYLEHFKRIDRLVSRTVNLSKSADAEDSGIAATVPKPVKKPPIHVKSPTETPDPNRHIIDISTYDSDSTCESRHTNEEQIHTDVDEIQMGEPGQPFTDSDMRLLVKHIAAHNPGQSAISMCTSFANRYPGRSGSSWAKFYSRKGTEIDLLVARYRKERRMAVQQLHACPSLAAKRTTSDLPVTSSTGKRLFPGNADMNKKRRKTDPKLTRSLSDMTWKDFT